MRGAVAWPLVLILQNWLVDQAFCSVVNKLLTSNGTLSPTSKTGRACKKLGTFVGMQGLLTRWLVRKLNAIQRSREAKSCSCSIRMSVKELCDAGLSERDSSLVAQSMDDSCDQIQATIDQLTMNRLLSSHDSEFVVVMPYCDSRKVRVRWQPTGPRDMTVSMQLQTKYSETFSRITCTRSELGYLLQHAESQGGAHWTIPALSRATPDDATRSVQLPATQSYPISLSSLQELYSRYQGPEDSFARYAWAVLAQYDGITCTAPGFQGSVDPRTMERARTLLRIDTECFASPLNVSLAHYYSLFPDTDSVFGSRGNLFQQSSLPPGRYEVNPPFMEDMLMDASDLVVRTLGKRSESCIVCEAQVGQASGPSETEFPPSTVATPLEGVLGTPRCASCSHTNHRDTRSQGCNTCGHLFFVVYPAWGDWPAHRALVDSPWCLEWQTVAAGEHAYVDGMGWTNDKQLWTARVDSVWYLLSSLETIDGASGTPKSWLEQLMPID